MKALTVREAFSYMWGARRADSIPAIHYAYGRLVDTVGDKEAIKLALYIDTAAMHSFHCRQYGEIELDRITNFEFNTTAPTESSRAFNLWLAVIRNKKFVSERTRKQQEDTPVQGVESHLSGACQ